MVIPPNQQTKKALLNDGRQRMIDMALQLGVDPKPLIQAVEALNEELKRENPGVNALLNKLGGLRAAIMAALYASAPVMPSHLLEQHFAPMKPRCEEMILRYVDDTGVVTPEMMAYLKLHLPRLAGGKPKPGGKPDRRLKENRHKPPRPSTNGGKKRKGK